MPCFLLYLHLNGKTFYFSPHVLLLRDLVRAINQKCSKMGSTCPRNTTVDAIRPSGTKPWNSKTYYPDHVPVVFPSIFPQKECLKRGELTISKHKEMNTRAQSVRLVSEHIASAL